MGQQNSISVTEKYVYLVIWIFAVLYALYRFINSSSLYFHSQEDKYADFTEGFYYLSGKRDKSDFEWEAIYYLMTQFYPWVFIYIMISEIIHTLPLTVKVYSLILQMWQISFTISYIISEMGYIVVLLMLMQPAIFFFICSIYHNLFITWSCSGISLLCITYCKYFFSDEKNIEILDLSYHKVYFMVVFLFWMNLKCTSYFLENKFSNILEFLSFCLYPPTIFTGPFLLYKDYQKMYVRTHVPFQSKMCKFLLNLCRCIFWFLFTNICLHYIYVNATSFQPKLVENLDNWSLYGYGYAMGQFFHIKYLVLYGLSSSFASYENVKVPHLPRCIGRIHLYSDMWKYFDPGLYNFLLRYIYIPVCNVSHYKLIASFTCFLFVFLWHGIENYILIWTILNYIGVALEYTTNLLHKRYFEETSFLKPYSCWLRRIKCSIASPLLVLSAISNFYFFAGTEIGNIFMKRILQDNFFANCILLIILYCCCQVSTELQSTAANKM